MTPRRILIDANPATDAHPTGVGYFTKGLIQALSRSPSAILAVYYFNFLGRHSFPTLKQFGGIDRLTIYHAPTRLVSLFGRIFGIRIPMFLFTLRRFDWIIYTNYVSFSGHRTGKVALVIHDLSFIDLPETLDEKNLNYLQKVVPASIQSADKLIAISAFTKQRLLYHFPETKDEDIIVTGIPPVIVRRSQKEANLQKRLVDLGIRNRNYFLFLGTLEPRKNIEVLVDAYLQLDEDVRNRYSLVLAGGMGWKSESLQTKIKTANDQGAAIILTGYVSNQERSALYANSYTYVMPSLYEGFGMPVLEAMQYELPCILSDLSVFREIAGSTVTYFDKSSSNALSQAMATFVNSGYRSVSYNEVLSRYTWDKVSDKIMKELQ